MRRLMLPTVLLLLVTGCATAAPEPDEAGYLEAVTIMLADDAAVIGDDGLVALGTELCSLAESGGSRLDEAADETARSAAALSGTTEADQRRILDPVEVAASIYLCPHLAE